MAKRPGSYHRDIKMKGMEPLNLPTTSTPPIPYDPDTLLVISFAVGRGGYYQQAAELASKAHRYGMVNGMHVAAFGRDIEGATRALAILDYIGQTRGCHVYTGSPMLWGAGRVQNVLRCYLGSLNCDRREEWCHVHQGGVLELMAGLPIRKLPCRKIVGYYVGRQLTWKECATELQAAGVAAGVEWCPCWQADDFLKDPHFCPEPTHGLHSAFHEDSNLLK